MLVGVDIGGTFTDLVASLDGRLQIHKLSSTPQEPASAMLAGLAVLSPKGLQAIKRVSHGSTVATNAILERKGARTALITTQGFSDILAIGRQNRPKLYALQPQLPPPLIPRRWCYGVPERLDHTGAVLTPLDLDALDIVLDALVQEQIESVAVCFLYSYLNPQHENMVHARILERGLLQAEQIALSCKVLPEFREYERASTVALDAYVRPAISRYLTQLEQALPPSAALRIMKSDGGVVSAQCARQQAVQTALSGPAAGVIGAFYLAQRAGYDHVITLDMGGTSTDVALCPGAPSRRTDSEIDGLPLRIRLLDIETIGAGGGSIARLDAGGALRVGPDSAGANPGPIIYGLGGSQVTVSDANAVLGRLDPAYFMGGAMPLYVEPAQIALESLAEAMGLGADAAALGVIDVTNVNIDRALRRVSIARGRDPRDFTLVAFGGAGPLHACEVAARLEIPRVLIPRYPGVLCALGLLVADVALDYSCALLTLLTRESLARLEVRLHNLIVRARRDLLNEGVVKDDMLFQGLVDMRYQGQAFELIIPFSDDLLADFHAAHTRSYGHAMPERAVELVNLRLQATGLVSKPALEPEPIVADDGTQALMGHKEMVAGGQRVQGALYQRDMLSPGAALAGPALLFQLDSTVFIPAAWSVRIDAYRNLVLERE